MDEGSLYGQTLGLDPSILTEGASLLHMHTSGRSIDLQDGAANGSYSALLFSVCNVFFVFPVFCFSNTISFTRDALLNIRQNTPQNLLPDFDYSDVLLDIVVGRAVALVKRFRTRRRGKRAGTLVKLRHRQSCSPFQPCVGLQSCPWHPCTALWSWPWEFGIWLIDCFCGQVVFYTGNKLRLPLRECS